MYPSLLLVVMGCPVSKETVVERTKQHAFDVVPTQKNPASVQGAETKLDSFPLSPAHAVKEHNFDDLSSPFSGLLKEGAHHLRNVFATPFSLIMGGAMPHMPHFSKSHQETEFLQQHLKTNYLFESLPENDLAKLIAHR